MRRYSQFSLITISAFTILLLPLQAMAENMDVANPRAIQSEEFYGINHVLDVLGQANVYRLDRTSSKTFQEYFDIKNAVNNRTTEQAVHSSKARLGGLSAPKRLNQRAF